MHHIRLPKRLASAALAAALALTPAAAFSDTAGHWAENSIAKWSEEYSIIQGYEDGTFRPDNSITRGAFAGIMDRFLQFQTISGAGTFSDIQGNYWESAILKLHAAGVYLGNNGKALAGNTITRQQAVTMIARAFRIDASTTELPYGDAGQFAEYARGPVAEMTIRGYITDCWDGNFRPQEPITRAEIVNILGNMIQTLLHTSGTYSEDVHGTLMINAADGAVLENMTVYGDLILAPGVVGDVTLSNVTVMGHTRNFSAILPTTITDPVIPEEPVDPMDPEEPEAPVVPGIQPSEVYTPGETTGEYIEYSGKRIPVYEEADPIRLGEGDFVWEDDRLVYVGDRFDTRFGIDVSSFQNQSCPDKTIDWEAVAADGVDFAMVRAGFRGYSSGSLNTDAFYGKNIEGAMDAGIETGVYFFAQAITVEEAIEEADYVIELLRDYDIDGPVAYDWEMHDASYRVYGTTPEMATACAIAFCERVAEAGYEPMIYAGQYVSYIKYDQGAMAPYLYWYPEYKNATSEKQYPTFYYQMDYWQFSSSCSIDGITGRVDANIQFIR